MEFIKKHLIDEISRNIKKNVAMEEAILRICNSYYENPVHNMQDMKLRNKKIKGDIFEYFTQLYLLHIYKLKNVWLLKDLPEDIREKLKLTKKDYGIDLIGQDDEGRFYAVQAKFKKRDVKSRVAVTWKQLSTFYALCARTGPYHKFIVCTTGDYVMRMGKKTWKDVTINYNNIKKITHFQWLDICKCEKTEIEKPEKTEIEKPQLTREELRQKRLLVFNN